MDLLFRLEAIEDIRRLKAQYFRFVDLKDWASLKTVFAPDVEFDRSAAASVFNCITQEWEPSRLSEPMIVKGRDAIMAIVKKQSKVI